MALYLGAALVDAYTETGDRSLLEAAQRQWDDLLATKMYITGGLGSRYRDEAIGDGYELPPDRAYCETCAAIGSVMLSWRLLLATGDGRYADLIERTLFNAVLPGVSLDGRTFFYANPLQVRTRHVDSPDGIGAAVRSPWFFCACCPPNVMRTLSSFEHLVATRTHNGVQIHQFVAGALNVAFDDGEVRLRTTTAYPWQGTVTIDVETAPQAEFELALRVPAWAADRATIEVNGDSVAALPDRQGCWRMTRPWRAGDRVVLTLPMQPRWIVADERIDAVRGCVAIERGPLVYCFEHVDQPDGVDLDEIDVVPGSLTETRVATLGDVIALQCEGFHLADPAPKWPYRVSGAAAATIVRRDPVTLTAIPYFAWANRARGAMRIWVPEHRG
jgi:DUF1680 family protein